MLEKYASSVQPYVPLYASVRPQRSISAVAAAATSLCQEGPRYPQARPKPLQQQSPRPFGRSIRQFLEGRVVQTSLLPAKSFVSFENSLSTASAAPISSIASGGGNGRHMTGLQVGYHLLTRVALKGLPDAQPPPSTEGPNVYLNLAWHVGAPIMMRSRPELCSHRPSIFARSNEAIEATIRPAAMGLTDLSSGWTKVSQKLAPVPSRWVQPARSSSFVHTDAAKLDEVQVGKLPSRVGFRRREQK